MSNAGRWGTWYTGIETPQAFGDVFSYERAAAFLEPCSTVEDWGTGKGFFKTLRPDAVGVDGTKTPFADVVADLTTYQSRCDGVLLRHVLEHNYEWEKILANAVATAQQRLCIVLFTPCGKVTEEIAFTEELGVPDIGFALPDILGSLDDFEVEVGVVATATQYGVETIIEAARK